MKRKTLIEMGWKLKRGEMLSRNPNEPKLFIVTGGRSPSLWIGNDAAEDKFCFATLSGAMRLRALANSILEQLT